MSPPTMSPFPPVNPGPQRGNLTRSRWPVQYRLLPRHWAELDQRDRVKFSIEFRVRMLKGVPHRRYAPLFPSSLRTVVAAADLPDPEPAAASGSGLSDDDDDDDDDDGTSPASSDLTKWSEEAEDDDGAYFLSESEQEEVVALEAAIDMSAEKEKEVVGRAEVAGATVESSLVAGEGGK